MQNLNGILTSTSFNGLLGCDKRDRQNKTGILTLTNLNGLLGSDQQECQNDDVPHFSAAKPQLWMRKQRSMPTATPTPE